MRLLAIWLVWSGIAFGSFSGSIGGGSPEGTAIRSTGEGAGEVLTADGAGGASWAAAGGGMSIGGTVTSGTDNSILFVNPAATLDESTEFLFDDASDTMTIGAAAGSGIIKGKDNAAGIAGNLDLRGGEATLFPNGGGTAILRGGVGANVGGVVELRAGTGPNGSGTIDSYVDTGTGNVLRWRVLNSGILTNGANTDDGSTASIQIVNTNNAFLRLSATTYGLSSYLGYSSLFLPTPFGMNHPGSGFSLLRNNKWSIGWDRPQGAGSQGGVQTTDATVTTIFSQTLEDDWVYFVEATCIAHGDAADKRAVYKRQAAVYREDAGGATLQGAVTAPFTEETDVGMDCTIDTSSNDFRVRAAGLAATTFEWTATVEIVRHQ